MPTSNQTEPRRMPLLPPLPPLPPIPGLDDFEIVMPEIPEATPSPWYWFGWRSNNDAVVPRSITVLQNRNRDLRMENERLQREIERLQNQDTNVDRQDDRDSQTIDRLRKQLAELKIRSDQQAQTIQGLHDQVSRTGEQDQTTEELSIRIADLSKMNDEQNQTIGRLDDQIDNLNTQNGQQDREIKKLKTQLADLKEVNNEHIKRVRDLHEMLSDCHEKHKRKAQIIEDLNEKLLQAGMDYNAQKRHLDAALKSVLEERDQAIQEAKVATEKLQKMTEEVIALEPRLTTSIKARLIQHFQEEDDIRRSATATHLSPSDPILATLREMAILDRKVSRCEEQILKTEEGKEWISSIYDERPVEVIETGIIEFAGIPVWKLEDWKKESDWEEAAWTNQQTLFREEFWAKAYEVARKYAEGLTEDKSWMREFVRKTGPGPGGKRLIIDGQIDPDDVVDDNWVPPPGTDWKNAGRQEWWYDEDPTRKEAILKARADFEKQYPDGFVPDDDDFKGWKDEDFCDTVPPNVDWNNTGRSSPIYDWDPPDPEEKVERKEDVTEPGPNDEE